MIKTFQLPLVFLLAAALPGCQKADDAVVKKLEQIASAEEKQTQILERMEKSLASGAAARPGAARPQPPRARAGRPDPGKVYAVPVDGAPFDGPKDAKVTIVKAFEFACPFCDRVRPTIAQLEKDYGKDVKVVYKNFVVHPQAATIPAQASCAAHLQGKYKAMYEGIWEKGFKAGRNLSAENMEAIAKGIGLNVAKFKSDMNGDACKNTVRKDQAQLSQVGTRGTPAFYINGRFLSGAQPIDRFKAVVDEELKKANERIEKGEATVGNYYEKFVLSVGEKKI